MSIPEHYLEQLEKKGYFIWDNFLSPADTEKLRLLWGKKIDQEEMKKAGIGRQDEFKIDASERGDYISWINPLDTEEITLTYLEKIRELITTLNRSFYFGIRDCECHFAYYPAGTRYAKHVDRHRSGSARVLSFVFYLNPDWKDSDGGQLIIYENGMPDINVLPAAGRLAVFLSEKEHEVALTHRSRMSITGWMLNDLRS